MNDWSALGGRTSAPQGKNGAILNGQDPSNRGVGSFAGQSSARIGAMGGNVGLLDGSVSWRKIDKMQVSGFVRIGRRELYRHVVKYSRELHRDWFW